MITWVWFGLQDRDARGGSEVRELPAGAPTAVLPSGLSEHAERDLTLCCAGCSLRRRSGSLKRVRIQALHTPIRPSVLAADSACPHGAGFPAVQREFLASVGGRAALSQGRGFGHDSENLTDAGSWRQRTYMRDGELIRGEGQGAGRGAEDFARSFPVRPSDPLAAAGRLDPLRIALIDKTTNGHHATSAAIHSS